MIQAATQSADRKAVPLQDRDFHRNITSLGRRTLMSLGRWMFWNLPALHGALLEQSNLAVSHFIPQFYGRNKLWGDLGENWLTEWHKVFDLAGPPYDYETYLQTLILCSLVDGDVGTVLTETPEGYPMIQVIPGHRIGARNLLEQIVVGGPYDGAKIIDGVIVNDYGRPLAYRVYNDPLINGEYQDIDARNMFLTFVPMFPGQVRGLPLVASSAFNFQDSQEYDRFEMLAQKACASNTLIETNESGEADPAKAIVKAPATYSSTGEKTALATETLDGGIYKYLKANTGSTLEAFHYDRPSANAQFFQERKIRDAFRGTEWDSFFSLDPDQVGGASMRIIVEKINAVLDKRRKMVGKACVRVDGYGIAKAIKNGDLPEDVDWWKFEYQGPGDITADRKYDSDVDLQEVAQGFSTRKLAVAKRGGYWEELDAQREAEARSDLQRAKRLADEFGITIQEALIILRPPTVNSQMPRPQQAAPEHGADGAGQDGSARSGDKQSK